MNTGQAIYERNVSKGMDRCAAMYLWDKYAERQKREHQRRVARSIHRLQNLLPELGAGRKTHLDWGEYFEMHPDEARLKPDLGDSAFHKEMVVAYDERIAAVSEAIELLGGRKT